MGCCGRYSHKTTNRMPNLMEQAKNLALSVANVLAYAAVTGQVKVDPKVAAIRVDTCNKCQHLEKNRCAVCGCFIAMKAGLVAEKCPIKKW